MPFTIVRALHCQMVYFTDIHKEALLTVLRESLATRELVAPNIQKRAATAATTEKNQDKTDKENLVAVTVIEDNLKLKEINDLQKAIQSNTEPPPPSDT